MSTMCWSWIFITSLLVQPGCAFHYYQGIHNVVGSRSLAGTKGFLWLRALQRLESKSSTGSGDIGVIVAVLLSLMALSIAMALTVIWYCGREDSPPSALGSGTQPRKGFDWWYTLMGRPKPVDVEKGEVASQNGASFFEKPNEKPPWEAIQPAANPHLQKPAASVLPHLPRYPSILERLSQSKPRYLSSSSRVKGSQASSRVLVAPPPPARGPSGGQGATGHRNGMLINHSTDRRTNKGVHNPFVPIREEEFHATVAGNIPPTQRLPRHPLPQHSLPQHLVPSQVAHPSANLDSPFVKPQNQKHPVPPPPRPKRHDVVREERVRRLQMDLSKDLLEVDDQVTPMPIVHLNESSASRLKSSSKPKSTKTLRFLLPSSPRGPITIAPLRSAAMGLIHRNGSGNSSEASFSATEESPPNWRHPKTSYI
ncbi:hypothetical protein AMATHDRAFT_56702 [Amanita thiersii Skay4041]|uniref:Uncharacterized protein n=1 Tax=Amanita thiersii Skay4041 TaxID=703135 RepID=A0A2A9NRA7_9AGAR|nr:hypothetical protein AMATHDRAFT_56702 [Amanita thiersii Skay4041]